MGTDETNLNWEIIKNIGNENRKAECMLAILSLESMTLPFITEGRFLNLKALSFGFMWSLLKCKYFNSTLCQLRSTSSRNVYFSMGSSVSLRATLKDPT